MPSNPNPQQIPIYDVIINKSGTTKNIAQNIAPTKQSDRGNIYIKSRTSERVDSKYKYNISWSDTPGGTRNGPFLMKVDSPAISPAQAGFYTSYALVEES